jgi:hypothetical protein
LNVEGRSGATGAAGRCQKKLRENRKEKERRGETMKPGRNGICSKLPCAGGQEGGDGREAEEK